MINLLIIVIAILAAVIAVEFWFFRFRNNRDALTPRLEEFSQTLFSLTEQVNSRLRDSAEATERSQHRTAEALGRVAEQMRRVDEFQRDLKTFQELLQPPKARGGIGERLLGQLLRDMLPEGEKIGTFTEQYLFPNGERVDFALRLKDFVIPIDVKFPKEAYERLRGAGSEEERERARGDFRRAVKQHVDAAAKYIRPNDGTADFVFLYFPFEGIFLAYSEDTALVDYALDSRVIVVSPGTFFAYLQTVLIGFRGLTIERSAKEILASLGQLERELETFSERFRIVGSHLRNALKAHEESDRQLAEIDRLISRWGGTGDA
ncbi:MAG: hypothetical protein A2991_01005 [Candidatus Terrybacteria bacterium RIFCSPLOWO2_01_FULL_58_14]|uniref:DNA recombination protein RmuC n=2 Tax=Candidatus Terryibacteriota TaxID=1817920 RepID=A0A1G2PWZ3_9BACT|nr:MAG: hypothetical protein A2682_01225 [Candidatus Terrybacteria bacterium RIFCSPHIGHO2_01_FULL_58_15]OHA52289.1 MAG: hypothetical protein A2991_01005 [Candidatus Terrybacteria bacterium RIFCSPLOWO2_01_FULL_58_14]